MPLLILVAEDDPAIRLSVSDFLEDLGYSVVAAEDGRQAMSMLQKYHPHLLISDIKMPYKNGYELIESIRKLPEYRLLPVILLSEHRDTDDRIKAYQVGCDMYLPKPFEMNELEAIIRNLLERSQIVHTELRFSQSDRLESSESEETTFSEIANDRDNSARFTEAFQLTQREQEVLELLIEGHSNIEIGQRLHLSHRTIEKYVSSLLRKLNCNNRIELIHLTLKRNLV